MRKRRKIMGKTRGNTGGIGPRGVRDRETGRGKWRPPTAAAEIFYELNCAGGLCPRESMCEDQTPRRRVLVRLVVVVEAASVSSTPTPDSLSLARAE